MNNLTSFLLAISIKTSHVKRRELNQARSRKGIIIFPPGMISHRGSVPTQVKKYFADREIEAPVPANIEFDFFKRVGKSVFLISSTMTGTKKIDVISSALMSASGRITPNVIPNVVRKTKGSSEMTMYSFNHRTDD